jgi:hypothetical protein
MSLGPIPVSVYANTGDGLHEVQDRELYVKAADYTRLQNSVNDLMEQLQLTRTRSGAVDGEEVQRVLDISRHEQYLSNLVTQIRHLISEWRPTAALTSGHDTCDAISALLRKPYPIAPADALEGGEFAKEMAKTPEQLAADYHRRLYSCGCSTVPKDGADIPYWCPVHPDEGTLLPRSGHNLVREPLAQETFSVRIPFRYDDAPPPVMSTVASMYNAIDQQEQLAADYHHGAALTQNQCGCGNSWGKCVCRENDAARAPAP